MTTRPPSIYTDEETPDISADDDSDTEIAPLPIVKQTVVQPPNSVTYHHPLVSPYHAPKRAGRSPVAITLQSTADSSSSSSSSSSPSHTEAASESLPPPSVLTRSNSVTADIEGELFDWSGPLPRVPFYEDASQNVVNLYRNPRAHETVVWVGLSCCLDALLYCFSFLPFKIAIALMAWLKILVTRACCCRRQKKKALVKNIDRPRKSGLQPKHIHALLQALIIAFGLLGVNTLIEYVNLNTYSTISKITWVKLYVLFNLFAVFDLILERVGKRMTGYLNWSVTVGGYSSRVYIVAASSLYVLLHCLVLTCQISTIHSAIDNGAEVLGVLINVKLSDLKDGFRTTLDQESLFKLSLQDVANRFKWIIFILMIGVQKLLRLYTLPTVQELQQLHGTWSWVHTWIDWINRSVLSGSCLSYILSAEFWTQSIMSLIAAARLFLWELFVGTFSPSISAALSSDAVYVLPTTASPSSKSAFQLFISKPPTFASFSAAGGEQSVDPTLLLVDALSVLPVWLPTFLYSAAVTFLIVVVIDAVKHATLALFNPDWLTPKVYKDYHKRLSSFFLLAPKLGLGDQKSSSFALAHFDFISLPLTVIIIRELWSCSIAIVNSCWWGSLWLGLLGKNVIVDLAIRQRCAVWYQQMHLANASLTYTIPIPPTPTLTGVSPLIKSQWLDGDPNAHFWLAAGLLFAFRFAIFLLLCFSKVGIRLILRAYAKRHHRRDLASGQETSPSPQSSPPRVKRNGKDLETNMASPVSGGRTVEKNKARREEKNQSARPLGKHRKQVSIAETVEVLHAASDVDTSETSSNESSSPPRARNSATTIASALARVHSDESDQLLKAALPSDRRKSLSLFAILKHAMKSNED